MRAIVVAIACLLALPHVARAQSADVPGLIKLVENQPADMDHSAWKEKRREAARKLAESKDPRAVPVLAKLAETETFDIIGEIAIEGLGTLGDLKAIPVLQRIVGDTSRDKGQRDLARKALAKLGASPNAATPAPAPAPVPAPGTPPANATPAPAPPPDTGLETAPRNETPSTASLLGTGAAQPQSSAIPELPALDDDVLAAYNRVTFAAGNAALNYDTDTKLLQATGNGSGDWSMRVEKPSLAYGADAAASVVAGFINPSGGSQTRGTQLEGSGDGEVRFYAGGLYGIARAAADVQVNYVSDVNVNNAGNDLRLTTTDADFQVAVGGGYGRILDIGGAIRVRRLARTLDANRALGKPIDGATAKKLQLTWWALRAERSTYRALVATIAILREAGVLLAEPDGGLTYEILNVLRDTYVYTRPSGFDANIEFGEGYLRRPAEEVANNVENGHVEQVLANAGYGAQLDDDKLEVSGTAYARLRVFAPMGQPSPYAIGGSLTATRFTYGEHGDPFGTFDVTGTVAYSSDDIMNVDSGLLIGAQLGFTYLINQASGLRIAAQVAENDGTFLLGATLTATYGLLEGTYSR
jgi:hypothetical protein